MSAEGILLRDAFFLGVELRLFWLVASLYGVCFLIGIVYLISALISAKISAFISLKNTIGRILTSGLWITAIIHTILIIFRTFEGMRPPFQTLYETLSWFAWSTTITYLYVQSRWREVHVPGLIVSGIAGAACFYSLFTRSPEIAPIPPALQSPWYEVHVITAFLAYAVFVVSFSVEFCYLTKIIFRIFKKLIFRIFKKIIKTPSDESPGIFGYIDEEFHRWTHRLVLFGFPLLTFAVFSGAAWANDAWGRYWSWDPKETWSLITWTVYAMYLHTKAIGRWRGAPASILNLLGFICMVMTFLGINWLTKFLNIPSIHTYAV